MGKKRTRKSYSREYKLDVVQQSYLRENISALASELGLSPAMIYKWRAAYDGSSSSSFPGKGVEKLTPEQAELQRIKAENAELRMERDILKKAIGIFPDTSG
ncbi:transposase [Fodinibius sp.]|uniref:transposase n=1 Tax=Fodinibius sp. TaxID=1872440 RepID=UPI002ACEF5E0|nr:transposase [Fodinibius sp.]MDZ7657652.1 transposase [Fodinibius sp.]